MDTSNKMPDKKKTIQKETKKATTKKKVPRNFVEKIQPAQANDANYSFVSPSSVAGMVRTEARRNSIFQLRAQVDQLRELGSYNAEGYAAISEAERKIFEQSACEADYSQGIHQLLGQLVQQRGTLEATKGAASKKKTLSKKNSQASNRKGGGGKKAAGKHGAMKYMEGFSSGSESSNVLPAVPQVNGSGMPMMPVPGNDGNHNRVGGNNNNVSIGAGTVNGGAPAVGHTPSTELYCGLDPAAIAPTSDMYGYAPPVMLDSYSAPLYQSNMGTPTYPEFMTYLNTLPRSNIHQLLWDQKQRILEQSLLVSQQHREIQRLTLLLDEYTVKSIALDTSQYMYPNFQQNMYGAEVNKEPEMNNYGTDGLLNNSKSLKNYALELESIIAKYGQVVAHVQECIQNAPNTEKTTWLMQNINIVNRVLQHQGNNIDNYTADVQSLEKIEKFIVCHVIPYYQAQTAAPKLEKSNEPMGGNNSKENFHDSSNSTNPTTTA